MRHLTVALAVLLACTAALSGCDDDADPTEPSNEILLSAEPSSELAQMIEETPSDFTWEFFNDEVVVAAESDGWTADLQLCAGRIEEGELIESTCSDPFESSASELSTGRTSGEIFPGSRWVPGSDWFPGSRWVPGSSWLGSDFVAPNAQAVAEAALSEVDLDPASQGMAIVYLQGSPQIDGIRPWGLILNREQ